MSKLLTRETQIAGAVRRTLTDERPVPIVVIPTAVKVRPGFKHALSYTVPSSLDRGFLRSKALSITLFARQ